MERTGTSRHGKLRERPGKEARETVTPQFLMIRYLEVRAVVKDAVERGQAAGEKSGRVAGNDLVDLLLDQGVLRIDDLVCPDLCHPARRLLHVGAVAPQAPPRRSASLSRVPTKSSPPGISPAAACSAKRLNRSSRIEWIDPASSEAASQERFNSVSSHMLRFVVFAGPMQRKRSSTMRTLEWM